jgi:hypothetical protein
VQHVGLHQLIGPPRSFLRRQRSIGIGLTLELRAKPPACRLGRRRSVARAPPPFCRGDARDQHAVVPPTRSPAVVMFVGHDRLLNARSSIAADGSRWSNMAVYRSR